MDIIARFRSKNVPFETMKLRTMFSTNSDYAWSTDSFRGVNRENVMYCRQIRNYGVKLKAINQYFQWEDRDDLTHISIR